MNNLEYETKKLINKKQKKLINKKQKRLSSPFRRTFLLLFLSPLLLFCSVSQTAAQQTGGAFTIEKSVISSGGGTISGGAITVESTVGQPSADLSQNPPFILFGGFITSSFVPTAANASISGRLITASGAGIRNVKVTLNYPNGTTRSVSTGAFGVYLFEDIPVGEIYVVTVSGKKFSFNNSAQVVLVNEQIVDLNFIAIEQ